MLPVYRTGILSQDVPVENSLPLSKTLPKRITNRKQYQCSKCRFQIAPTANTIFHKSSTPLTLWFHAIFIFSNAKSGISAKEMERQLGVTYKCAYRILKSIRTALGQDKRPLSGDVEMDTAYLGGRKSGGKNNEDLSSAMKAKAVVMGAVERGGSMRALVTPDNKSATLGKFLEENVSKENTRLMTDSARTYMKVAKDYNRHAVNHKQREYVRGDVYVNNVEYFWSHVKRSMKGTYKMVSKKYVQEYLDAFVFHYNNRHNDRERFAVLLGALVSA